MESNDAYNSITDFDPVIITCNHDEYRELNEVLKNSVVYDGRYILDLETFEGTLLQPGRIGILN
jgi:UDP-N-acetyl-D-mannosaminuronate dehydrogenase